MANEVEKLALTERALLRSFHAVVAIMADQLAVGPVIRHRDVAVLASQALAARTAKNERRKPAPIDQYHRLLAACVRFLDRGDQGGRENDVLAGPSENVAHINQFGLGKRPAADALMKLQVS